MKQLLIKFFHSIANHLHSHVWETTHSNRWYHPTRQKCACGEIREMVQKTGDYTRAGPPWENVEWELSSGKKQKYSVLD